MAVAYDAVGGGNFALSAGGSISWSHTSSGSDRCVIVPIICGINGVAPASHTRGVTYGGVAMTSLGTQESGSGSGGWVELFALFGQATGAQTVAVTVSAADVLLIGNSVSYTGVASLATRVTAVGTTGAPSIAASSVSGNMVIAGIAGANSLSGPTQTQRYLKNGNTNNAATNLLIQDVAGAASVTLACATLNDWWGAMAVELIATDSPPLKVASANAVTTASRSPAVTFTGYVPVENDIVAFWASSTTAAAAATAPTNWVLPTPASGANPVASDSHTQAFTYHVVTSGEATGGTTTYTATNLWNATQTGNVVAAVIRNVDTTTPIDSSASTFDSTNTVTPSVLAALTGSNLSTNSRVLSAVVGDATRTYTTPASWTLVTSFNTNQGHWLGSRDTLTTSGTNVSATNITPSVGDEYSSITVAFSALSTGAAGTLAAALLKATASFTGVMQPSGTLAAANQKATFAATGAQTIPSTLAASNQKATAALTGVMQPSGVVAAALQLLSVSLTGSQIQTGTLAAAVQKLVFTGTGAQTQTGALAAANQRATAALLGWMEPSGAIAAALQRPAMAASGEQTLSGAIASATQALAAGLTGAQAQTGTLAVAIQIATATLAGVMQPSGVLAAVDKPPLFASSGAQAQQGALAAALQVLTASLAGSQVQSGSLAAAIPLLATALSGSAQQSGTLAASVQRLVFAAAAEQVHVGALAAATQLLLASFTGDMPMTGALAALLKPLSAELTGSTANAPAALFATLQPLASNLTGIMLPSGQLTADLELLAFNGLGSQTLSGSLAAGLQVLSASLTGQQPFTGTLSGLLVPTQLQASGTQAYDGAMTAELQELAAELLGGFAPPEGILSATLPTLAAVLEGTGGVPVGTLSASIPELVFSSLVKVYRLALERLTAVEVDDRSVHVSLDSRLIAVEAEARNNGVEVPPRTTAATVDNRITTVIREG